MPKKKLHIAEKYMDAVLSDKIKSCELIKLAAQRHLSDLENAKDLGLKFNPKAAQHVIEFFDFLKHSKGEWAGKKFELEAFQQFKLYILFGWYKADGTRRFKTAYNEIPRKNGKTTEAAGVALYLLTGDGEYGAEVYAAATKKDQARIAFSEAKNMTNRSEFLRKYLKTSTNNISFQGTLSKMEPLASDSNTLDGLNVHGAIIDELHAHKTSEVVDLLDTATGARLNPLIYEITTAGFNKMSVCFKHRDYSEKVLRGIFKDESWASFIFTIDQKDDWKDEESWYKANPNLGGSKKLTYMRQQFEKAVNMPSFENTFKRLDLNIWTSQETKWLSDESWTDCNRKISLGDLENVTCYGGLDLASTSDITSLCITFIIDPATIASFWWNFVPKETAEQRHFKDKVGYLDWARSGDIILTPGDVTDYDFIEAKIIELKDRFKKLKSIGYDRWNASHIVNNLIKAGVSMDPFGQGFKSMSEPTKTLEKIIKSKKLIHNNNPVARWALSNVVIVKDPAENIKIDKSKSTEKVDPIIAQVISIGEWLTEGGNTNPNPYEERGIREL